MIFVNGDLLEKLEKPSDICKWLSPELCLGVKGMSVA